MPFATRAKLLTLCSLRFVLRSLRPAHCALHSQNMTGDFMIPVRDCTVPVGDTAHTANPARDLAFVKSIDAKTKWPSETEAAFFMR